jgi:WD40 repeat protein
MFSGSYDKTVRVWDVDNLTCLATLQGHSGAVRALAASPTLVFSGSDDTTIKVGSAVQAHAGDRAFRKGLMQTAPSLFLHLLTSFQ